MRCSRRWAPTVRSTCSRRTAPTWSSTSRAGWPRKPSRLPQFAAIAAGLRCRIQPLRILLISDFYWPYLGGVEQHVRSLAHSLTEQGHSVTVATLAGKDLAQEEYDDAVRVRRLGSMSQRMSGFFTSAERPWAPPLPDPAITWQLRRLIVADPPDIVHGHDWLCRSFLPLRKWAQKRYGTRFLSTLHYYTLSCAKKNLMRSEMTDGHVIETPCSGPAVTKCLACAWRHYGPITGTLTATGNALGAAAERRAASTIIAVSTATARGNGLAPGASRAGGAAVVVVPNFLTAVAEDDRAKRDGATTLAANVPALVERLPQGQFIVFVGDLRPMKGLDVLLAAYRGFENAPPLVLIGKSWPDTPTDLPNGVTVHDRWPNAAVIEAFRRSSIAVVPSVWAEPFGIVVIEAMAGGTPVIGSNVGGIPEIIEDGISGVLVPPSDPIALRRALADLIGDPDRRSVMGEAARRRAQDFTAAHVVPQLENEYRQSTSSR
ncbi:MAG TPA: glycosyltransferase family 4 protein [Ilumatobacteraceae bacterium]